MARVHHRKARKDYPNFGIKKGDMYYFAQIKTGARSSRKLRSLKPFKRSQLTSSEFKSAAYDLDDQASEAQAPDDLRSIAEEIRQLGQEQDEKFNNMPEGLQQGDTGQLLQERWDGCEEWATELDRVADEWESKLNELEEGEGSDDEENEPEETEESIRSAMIDEASSVCQF